MRGQDPVAVVNTTAFNGRLTVGINSRKRRINTLIKIEPQKWSLPEISFNSCIDENLLKKLTSLPSSFEIFVDPEDLL